VTRYDHTKLDEALDRMWSTLRPVDRYWVPHGGWYHSTRSVAAHCWERGYPLCQDSDPGRAIYCGPWEKSIGRTCETCRNILRSRILMNIRKNSSRKQ
jgi:hypothetical protein